MVTRVYGSSSVVETEDGYFFARYPQSQVAQALVQMLAYAVRAYGI